MRCPRRPKQVLMCHHQVARPTHRTRWLVRLGPWRARQQREHRTSCHRAVQQRLFCTSPPVRAPTTPSLRGYVERRRARWVGLICASREHATRWMMRCPRRPKQVFMCHHQLTRPAHRTRWLVRLALCRERQLRRRHTSCNCAVLARLFCASPPYRAPTTPMLRVCVERRPAHKSCLHMQRLFKLLDTKDALRARVVRGFRNIRVVTRARASLDHTV